MSLLAIWLLLKPYLLTTLAPWLVGWLMPSPLKKKENADAKIDNAVSKASNSRGDFSGLDNV